MAEDPRAKYGLSCPTGGSFYICGLSDTQFVGCCDHDPCTSDRNGICEDDALHPASFSSTNYIDIPPQSCVEPYDEQNWWTCQNAIPPFLGCCKSNPCNAGCPDDDLIPSRLSDNQTNAEPFLATSSSSATQSPVPAAEETPTALIVGVSVGGLVVLFAGIAAFLWRKRQREKKQAAATYTEDNAAQGQPPVTPSGGDPAMMMGQQYSPYKGKAKQDLAKWGYMGCAGLTPLAHRFISEYRPFVSIPVPIKHRHAESPNVNGVDMLVSEGRQVCPPQPAHLAVIGAQRRGLRSRAAAGGKQPPTGAGARWRRPAKWG